MNVDNSHIAKDNANRESSPEKASQPIQEDDLVYKTQQSRNHIYRVKNLTEKRATLKPVYTDKGMTGGNVFKPQEKLVKATEQDIEHAKNLVRKGNLVCVKSRFRKRPPEIFRVSAIDRMADIASIEVITAPKGKKSFKHVSDDGKIAVSKLAKVTDEEAKKSRRFYRPEDVELDSSIVDQFEEGEPVIYSIVVGKTLLGQKKTKESLCVVEKIHQPTKQHSKGRIILADYHTKKTRDDVIIIENISKAPDDIVASANNEPPTNVFQTGSVVVIHDPHEETPTEIVVRLNASSTKDGALNATSVATGEGKGLISDITKILRVAHDDEKRAAQKQERERTSSRLSKPIKQKSKAVAKETSPETPAENLNAADVKELVTTLKQQFKKIESTSVRLEQAAKDSHAVAAIDATIGEDNEKIKGLPQELYTIFNTLDASVKQLGETINKAEQLTGSDQKDSEQPDSAPRSEI